MLNWDTLRHPLRYVNRLGNRPIHVDWYKNGAESADKHTFYHATRFGYGETCDLRMDGPRGPEVLFELNRDKGPLCISSPLSPENLKRHVDLSLDGRPLVAPNQPLAPGTRVDVLDKATQRRYRLVVEPRRPFWLRSRVLAIAALVLALGMVGYGGYLYHALNATRGELAETRRRLNRTEFSISSAESRVDAALKRIESTETLLVASLREFKAQQSLMDLDLRREFDSRLAEIREEARGQLAAISDEDSQGRRRLAEETRIRIERLREELSEEMVTTYQQFKATEEELNQALAARLDVVEVEGESFKRIFSGVRKNLVFIRTDYKVEFPRLGEVRDFTTFGTGYIVSSTGVGITARHILAPWLFDRKLIVFQQLGLAKVITDSLTVTMWPTDSRVTDEGQRPTQYFVQNGFRMDGERREIRILYFPELDLNDETVNSPMGRIEVPFPVMGPSDIGVFQIADFDHRYDPLHFPEPSRQTATLDEVLVVGYPLSRLQKGVAVPQASRGVVRRIGAGIIELDSPLHPGVSGGPILNRRGDLIGMAVGIIDSPVYGLAVPAEDLQEALRKTRDIVAADQRRLAEAGCHPGAIDGVIGRKTWEAYRCEAALHAEQAAAE